MPVYIILSILWATSRQTSCSVAQWAKNGKIVINNVYVISSGCMIRLKSTFFEIFLHSAGAAPLKKKLKNVGL